jgi:diguanylate cyclase (GGDEF)-like protein
MTGGAEASSEGGAPGLEESPVAFTAEATVVPLDEHRRAAATMVGLPVSSPRSGQLWRILVVSGDEECFLLVRDLLARAEPPLYRVEWAATGEAALRRLTASHYDVAVVDEVLPDGEGTEFVRVAQRRGFRTPVVLVSEDLDQLDPATVIALGVGDAIAKEELEVGRLVRSLRFAVARKAQTDRLDHLAQYDDLTGLANRALLRDRLARALAAARRRHTHVAVMILDLDGFKAVNDTLGHAAGDRLLAVIAERLRGRVRETDTVARLGGDEFALVIEDLARPEHATTVARKLLDTIEPPVRLDGQEARVGASLGVAIYPRDGEDPAVLLRLADAAMYQVKAEGGRGCRFHDARLDQRMHRGTILEGDLHRALERGEFVLHFQPQVALADAPIGVAAILRWQHPELGLVEVERFRSVAEESGLVEPLSAWLTREATARLRGWRDAGLGELVLSLPVLSRRQLAWSRYGELVAASLREAGLSRTGIELEIEERLVSEDVEAGGAGLRALVELGLRVAIDRFGAGPCGLRPLREVPIHTLKFDRELVRGVPEDAHRTRFLRALVGFGKALGLRVVVEGVETRAQLTLLKAAGCDAVQAVTSCPPLPADACGAWLREAAGRSPPTSN